MAFQGVLAMLIVFMIIFMIISSIVTLSGILGIVFGCISADKSGKYVTMRGNTDFKSVKNYSTAAKAFLIANSVALGLAAILIILMTIEVGAQDFQYGSMHDEYDDVSVPGLIVNYLFSSAIPVASIVTGAISVKKFKEASALKEELDSKGLKSYPLPNNPYFNAQQRYQTPYQNQYGSAYQNQYYNGQYPNQYQSQYQYQGQYPNQYQNQGYNPVMQGKGQPAPQANFTTAAVKCPHCGTENSGSNRFCVNCGENLK